MRYVINSLTVNGFGDKDNTPIIFIHGFPFDYTMWEYQIKALQSDYFCVAYDMRGLGSSYVGDGQYTMEAYVDDLFSIISGMQLSKPVICGLSMGGYIALRAVERDQSRFSALILCDTKSDADNDEAKLKRAAGINQINVEGLHKFVNKFVPNCFAEDTPKKLKKVYSNVLGIAQSHNPIGVKGALFAMLSRTDTTKFLRKIKIPTLVMVGTLDKLTPPPLMRDMAAKIKNSEFGIAPRAGHVSPLENPSFINDMIKGFLKRRLD